MILEMDGIALLSEEFALLVLLEEGLLSNSEGMLTCGSLRIWLCELAEEDGQEDAVDVQLGWLSFEELLILFSVESGA